MAIKKIEVDKETCIGCGQCVSIADKAYEMSDEGTASVKDTWQEEDPKIIQEACESCPVNAISIEEE